MPPNTVMAGLVPAIHVLLCGTKEDVDARHKAGHDDRRTQPGSTMRLRIAHSTSYRYEPAATGVIQILRMTPGSHDGQYVAEWQIDVSTDSRLDMHQDAFGNVTHVLTHGPIADLTITCRGPDRDPRHRRRAARHRRALSAEPVPALDRADRSQSGDGDVRPRAALGVRRRRARLPACADGADQRAHDVRRGPDQQRHLGGRSVRAQARRLPGLRAHLHRLRALRRRAGAFRLRAFPALRRHRQPAGRPRLGGSLRA